MVNDKKYVSKFIYVANGCRRTNWKNIYMLNDLVDRKLNNINVIAYEVQHVINVALLS